MELLACIRVLKWIRESGPWSGVSRVQIFTDSQYVKDNLGRARGWKSNDWRNQHGEPRENPDLWKQLLSAHTKTGITVHFEWTLGKKTPVLKSVGEQAKGILKQLLAGQRPGINDLAREMHLSTRTLQRRLTEQGITFQRLLDEARRELARHYLLHSSRELNETAYLLGYEDANSFFRAFHQWEGTSPGQWRLLQKNLQPTTQAQIGVA